MYSILYYTNIHTTNILFTIKTISNYLLIVLENGCGGLTENRTTDVKARKLLTL